MPAEVEAVPSGGEGERSRKEADRRSAVVQGDDAVRPAGGAARSVGDDGSVSRGDASADGVPGPSAVRLPVLCKLQIWMSSRARALRGQGWRSTSAGWQRLLFR